MIRKIAVFFIITLCFLLQNTLFQALALASISPNLLIVVTSSFGFMRGRREGMWIGFFSGLLIDIFYGDVIGFYALIYAYIGYVNGMFRKMYFPDDIKLPLMLIAASDLLCNIVVYLAQFLLRGRFQFMYYMQHIMLPELVYTALVAIVLYFIILKINQKLEAIEKRSATKFV